MTLDEIKERINKLSPNDRAELLGWLIFTEIQTKGIRYEWPKEVDAKAIKDVQLHIRHDSKNLLRAAYDPLDILKVIVQLMLLDQSREFTEQENGKGIELKTTAKSAEIILPESEDTLLMIFEVESVTTFDEVDVPNSKFFREYDILAKLPDAVWLLLNKAQEFVHKYLAPALHSAMILFLSKAILVARGGEISADVLESFKEQLDADLRAILPVRGQGGPNRAPDYNWTDEVCKQFARKVEELHELWEKITGYFEKQDYDSGCPDSVKGLSWFKSLSQGCTSVPDDLLKRVFNRKSKSGKEYEPLSFALLHAARELGIKRKIKDGEKEYQPNTLHGYYKKGLDV